MGFVDLPKELRSGEVRRPDGKRLRYTLSIYAGEVVHARPLQPQRRSRGKNASVALTLRTDHQERRFEFEHVPFGFEQGHLAGVAAVMPDRKRKGPIIAVADLDRDAKLEFAARELEMLRRLGAYSADYRRPSAKALAMFGAPVRAALLAALAAGAIWGVQAIAAADPAISPSVAFSVGLIGNEMLSMAQYLQSINAPFWLGVGSIPYFMISAFLRTRRRAAFQNALLRKIWTGVSDALGYVQDRAHEYRSTIDEDGMPAAHPAAPIAPRRPEPPRTAPLAAAPLHRPEPRPEPFVEPEPYQPRPAPQRPAHPERTAYPEPAAYGEMDDYPDPAYPQRTAYPDPYYEEEEEAVYARGPEDAFTAMEAARRALEKVQNRSSNGGSHRQMSPHSFDSEPDFVGAPRKRESNSFRAPQRIEVDSRGRRDPTLEKKSAAPGGALTSGVRRAPH